MHRLLHSSTSPRIFPAVLAAACLAGACLVVAVHLLDSSSPLPEPAYFVELEEPSYKLGRIERKAARADYFHQILRDPATNRIPQYVRQRELRVAQRLPKRIDGLSKTATMTWEEAGPNDVGGRTRALGIDVRDSDVVLAGGTSGGIWKSTDGGETWTLKSDPSDPLSVTWLVQHPSELDTWYYATGEYSGGSAGDLGSKARFHGSGLYRSTDNGDSWERIHEAGSPVDNDSPFDFVSRIEVSPTTESVFIASNTSGIHRSTDDGDSFTLVLGGSDEHTWSDVVIGSDGRLVAVLSGGDSSPPENEPGVYVSTDDGSTWDPLPVDEFSAAPSRSVLAISASNPDAAYLMSDTEPASFYKLDLAAMTAEDRSTNLPDFGEPVGGLDFQGGYNMVVGVHPDDEHHVLIGATNLFRSRDGFATPADDPDDGWIGGYSNLNEIDLYPNQHPDQHVFVFDPNDPDRLWAGHDGGLSVLPDVTLSEAVMPWESKNNGYNVTQYYAVALSRAVGDDRLVGGTQDNGSPFFTYDGSTTSASFDASGGDGAFAYLGESFAYVSVQQGTVLRRAYDDTGAPQATNDRIDPMDAEEALFINPFAVDPIDEDVMYFPAVDKLWRTTSLSTIDDGEGWELMDQLDVPPGFTLTSLNASSTPAHVLYVGLSSDTERPRILRLEDAHTASDGEVIVEVDGAPGGGWVHDVAVNPNDGDEIMVVLSNYGVIGLFHSTDGGATFDAVEGNLHAAGEGPSLRAAGFLPLGEGMLYVVGTSTGVYSTAGLNGMDTVWEQEGTQELGNVVVADLDVRPADGFMAAGTHGRGIFVGQAPIGNLAPVARFAVERSLSDPLTATLNAGASADPNGDEITYAWDLGDGTGGSGEVVTHTYAEAGTYEVTLEVSDPEGLLDTESQSVEIGGVIARTVRSFDPQEQLGMSAYDVVAPIDSGFVFGPNPFGQRQLAGALSLPDGAGEAVLTEVRIVWGYKREDVSTETYTLNVFDGDAETGPIGDPLFSREYPLAEIDADADPSSGGDATVYAIEAGDPVVVGSSFFVGIDFGDFGDAVWGAAGLAEQHVNEPTPETWIQWSSDGLWTSYSDMFTEIGDRLVMLANVEFGGVTASVPAAPVVVGPEDGATEVGVDVDLVWNAVDGAATYDLQVGLDAALSSPVDDVTGLDSTSYALRDLIPDTTYFWRVRGVNASGDGSWTESHAFTTNATGVHTGRDELPDRFALEQNYPNPFNPRTTIRYALPEAAPVSLTVYDAAGRQVALLVDGTQPAGRYELVWDATAVSSGVYHYRMQAGDYAEVRSMVLVR